MNKQIREFKKKHPQLFYETEKVKVSDILPGFSTPQGSEYAIVTHTDKKKVITNFCSNSYKLVTNEELLVPMLEVILDEFPDVDIKASSQRDARFYIDFIFQKRLNVAKEAMKKGEKDIVFPKFRLINSYDGKIKYSREFGFHRLICSNGLSVPEGERIVEGGLHTDSLDQLVNQEALINSTQNFLDNARNYMVGYRTLQSQKVRNLEERIEEVLEATKFPKRQSEAVAERVMKEMEALKSEANDWLVYNGFNGELNHNSEFKMTTSKRQEVDKQVLKFLTEG